MKYNKLLYKGLIFTLVIIIPFSFLIAIFPLKFKKILAHHLKKPNYTHITMQSWLKQDWPKALSTSQKLSNSLFYTAIMSDYLLNYQNHSDYLTLLEEFISKNLFWPKNSLLTQNAEKYLSKYPNSKVIAWVEKYGLKTLGGKKNYLKALEEYKNKDMALIIKNIWHKDRTFSADQEQEFFNTYKSYLTCQDHLLRANSLAWHRKKDIAFTTSLLNNIDKQALECRILLQEKNPNAIAQYAKLIQQKNISPILANGLVYEFLRFYKDTSLDKKKRKLIVQDLINLPAEEKYVNKWCNIRICYAREMILLKEYSLAYKLASENRAKISSNSHLKAHHLAGFIALTKLKNSNLALKHFNLIKQCALYPSQISKNYYFLHLCLKNCKKAEAQELAKQYLEQASKYVATFYGQVANATLNKTAFAKLNDANYYQNSDNLNKIHQHIEFIKTLSKYRKYKLTDVLLTDIFRSLNKQEIFAATKILTEEVEQTWKMMVANCALNKNVVLPDKLFPIIKLPDSVKDSHIIHAIIRKESVFDLNAISHKMATGLMQLTDATAQFCVKKMYSKHNNLDSDSNIILGDYYINSFFKKLYNQNLVLSIAAYHAGRENVRKWIKLLGPIKGKDDIAGAIEWIESIPFFSTQEYIQSVIRNKNMYFAMQNQGKFCIKDDLN